MRTPICFYQTKQRHSQPRCDKTHYLRLFRTAINIGLHRMTIKQNCLGVFVFIRMPYVCSLAINKPLHREKEHCGLLTMQLWPSKNQFRLTITSVHNKLVSSKNHQLTNARTHQLKNSLTQKLTNSSTQKPINVLTHKPINSKNHELINLKTHQLKKPSTHKLTNLSTQKLTNSSTHEPANLSAQKLTNPSTHKLTNSKNHQLKNLNCYLLFYNTVLIFAPF